MSSCHDKWASCQRDTVEYAARCRAAAKTVEAGAARLRQKGRGNVERLDNKTDLLNRRRQVAQNCREVVEEAERANEPRIAEKLRRAEAKAHDAASRLARARGDLYDACTMRLVNKEDGPPHRRIALGKGSLIVHDGWAEMFGDFGGPADQTEHAALNRVPDLMNRAEKLAARLGSLSATRDDEAAAETLEAETLAVVDQLDECAAKLEREGRDPARLRLCAEAARRTAGLVRRPLAVFRRWAAARLLAAAQRVAPQTRFAYRRTRRFAPRRVARGFRAVRRASAVAQKAASGGGGGDDGSGLDPAPKSPAAFSSARRPTFASVLRTTGGAL